MRLSHSYKDIFEEPSLLLYRRGKSLKDIEFFNSKIELRISFYSWSILYFFFLIIFSLF